MSHGLVLQKVGGKSVGLRLTLGAYFSIEREVGESLSVITSRLQRGTFMLRDLTVTLHHLLIGGGMTPVAASDAMANMSIKEVQVLRFSCIFAVAAASQGDEGEESGKKGGTAKFERSDFYRQAFALGMKPAEADTLTVWEWEQCIEGWNLAHGEEASGAPSESTLDALIAKYG